MSHNQFRVGTIPPPPPPAIPGYSPLPPGPPAGDHGGAGPCSSPRCSSALWWLAWPRRRSPFRPATPRPRRRPRCPHPSRSQCRPLHRRPRAPLPTAQADRQTCHGLHRDAGSHHRLGHRCTICPSTGVTILDPAVQANPEWTAAVRKAGESLQQASDVAQGRDSPGTTPVLAEAANTAVKALPRTRRLPTSN